MRLQLDPALAEGYRSPAQRARRITEGWFRANMFCPACPSEKLGPTPDNTRVVDFVCPACGAEFQLKARSGRFGRKLRDAAYAPMMRRILENRCPHFAFLRYDTADWRVTERAPGRGSEKLTLSTCGLRGLMIKYLREQGRADLLCRASV